MFASLSAIRQVILNILLYQGCKLLFFQTHTSEAILEKGSTFQKRFKYEKSKNKKDQFQSKTVQKQQGAAYQFHFSLLLFKSHERKQSCDWLSKNHLLYNVQTCLQYMADIIIYSYQAQLNVVSGKSNGSGTMKLNLSESYQNNVAYYIHVFVYMTVFSLKCFEYVSWSRLYSGKMINWNDLLMTTFLLNVSAGIQ